MTPSLLNDRNTRNRSRRNRLRAAALCLGVAAPFAVEAQCTTPCAPANDFSRLSLVIELHVENRFLPTASEMDYVRTIAESANAAGVPLNVSLGVAVLGDFSNGTAGEDLAEAVAYLQDDCCHQVSLHADVPEDMDGLEISGYLDDYLSQLADAGADATVASGVCNEVGGRIGWVEAARDAGLQAVAGVVEYCQGSLARNHREYLDPNDCSPSECHDAAPLDRPEQRVATWKTRRTRRWIDPIRSRRPALVVLGGLGSANLPCLAEAAAGRSPNCTSSGYDDIGDANDDAAAFVDIVEQALSDYRSGGTGDVVYLTFSTNAEANGLWLDAFFSSVQSQLGSRTDGAGHFLADVTQWSTLPAVAFENR